MQSAVSTWYELFKEDTKQRLKEKLLAVFHRGASAPDRANAISSAHLHSILKALIITVKSLEARVQQLEARLDGV